MNSFNPVDDELVDDLDLEDDDDLEYVPLDDEEEDLDDDLDDDFDDDDEYDPDADYDG